MGVDADAETVDEAGWGSLISAAQEGMYGGEKVFLYRN